MSLKKALSFKFIWLIIIALLLQFLSIRFIGPSSYLWLGKTLLIISYLLLIFAIAFNLRWWCFRIILLGLLLNFLVMVSNRGLMPISPEAMQAAGLNEKYSSIQSGQPIPASKDILLDKNDINLIFLSDVFTIRYPIQRAYSPGDVIIVAGIPIFIIELVRKIRLVRKAKFAGE